MSSWLNERPNAAPGRYALSPQSLIEFLRQSNLYVFAALSHLGATMTSSLKICGFARALAVLAALLVAASLQTASAKDKQTYVKWNVGGILIGKHEGKPSKDISGIACATDNGFPRTCVVIDDELQAAQVVTLRDGTIDADPQHMIKLIDDKFAKKPGEPPKAVELDGEGVAYAGGYFYVIGSHGRPRSENKSPAKIAARLKASSNLIRFKLDGTKARELSVSTALAKVIAKEGLFDAARKIELEKGGITIEGVAVLGGRLYAGFRGPTVGEKRQAVIMSANLDHLFGNAPAVTMPHRLDLGGGRGVRDLAPYDNGILILAGPVKSDEGTYSVFWWDGSSTTVKHLKDLSPDTYTSKKGKQWKPEALLPLDRNKNGLRVLLLLDSGKNGKPRTERIPYP